jgi:acetyl esterase/lipase
MVHEFPPRGVLESVLATVLRWTLKLLLKPIFSPRFSLAFQRRWLAGLSKIAIGTRGVSIIGGTVGGVPGEWSRRTGAPARPGSILYLHGGAYCVGSPATHRALTSRLARVTGLPVFAADYRLAPEHPYPAALDDAIAAYRALRADGPVILMGDSAGGGLALATALALRDAGAPAPAALALFSPWVDLAPPSPPPLAPPGEAMLSWGWTAVCARHYVGPDAPAAPSAQPLVSPLHADLHGLPPVLIQAGTDELLHPQALALHDALQAAGVDVRCEITAHRWHVFQLHANALPSANAAIDRVARFVLGPLAAATPPTGPPSTRW